MSDAAVATAAPEPDEPEELPEVNNDDIADDCMMLDSIAGYIAAITPVLYPAFDDDAEAWKGSPLDGVELVAVRASFLAAVCRAHRLFTSDIKGAA